MAVNRFIISLVVIGLFSSCDKNQTDPQVSLVFGEAYGFCSMDCAHFFQTKGDNLYQDNMERYTGAEPTFDALGLSQAKYDLAKPLLQNFPDYLFSHPNQTFGCPDCADQGGIHLYYKTESTTYFWHIDTFVDDQPIEIREYISQVRDVFDLLHN